MVMIFTPTVVQVFVESDRSVQEFADSIHGDLCGVVHAKLDGGMMVPLSLKVIDTFYRRFTLKIKLER